MKFKTLVKICYELVFQLDFKVGYKKISSWKNYTNGQPIQPKSYWFGFYCISKVNWTKSNWMVFYLKVWM